MCIRDSSVNGEGSVKAPTEKLVPLLVVARKREGGVAKFPAEPTPSMAVRSLGECHADGVAGVVVELAPALVGAAWHFR